MSRRAATTTMLAAIATLAAAGAALADHSNPPTYLEAGPMTITVSEESRAGQVYHDRNDPGVGGTACTAKPSDDGTGDDTGECWNERSDLKAKDVSGAEGTAANCQRMQGATVPGVATWDGLWFNRTPAGTIPDACGDPTAGGAKGRAYTGAEVNGVGDVGLAAGGDLATGGCVQGFAEDDTQGNQVSTTVNTVQSAAGSPHTGTDDDTDASVCFDYL